MIIKYERIMSIEYIMSNVIDVNGDAWVNQKSKVVIVIINENHSHHFTYG